MPYPHTPSWFNFMLYIQLYVWKFSHHGHWCASDVGAPPLDTQQYIEVEFYRCKTTMLPFGFNPNSTLVLLFHSQPSCFHLWCEGSWLVHLRPPSLITLHSRVNASYVRTAAHEARHAESHTVLSPRLHLGTNNRGCVPIEKFHIFLYMYWVDNTQEICVYKRLLSYTRCALVLQAKNTVMIHYRIDNSAKCITD